jgi:SAM-dependent methyltransferase
VRVKALEPGPPWDYEATARELARSAGSVLDLGTGGGERLSEIVRGSRARVTATESWETNVPVAHRRLAPLGVRVVQASSLRLPFVDAAFDLVLDRHEELDPREVVRVLRPGGRFLTQQVDRNDWKELRRYFRLTDFGDQFVEYKEALEAEGMVVQGARHDQRVAYGGLGDVVFMLLTAPDTVPDFDPEREIGGLLALEDEHGTADGIVLTESRFILSARREE